MKRLLWTVLALVSVLLVSVAASASEEALITSLVEGRAAVKQVPLPSAQLPGLTVEKAYDIQKKVGKALVAKGDKVSGFKAGLTSEAGRKKFGLESALVGPIFGSGELGPDAVVNAKDFVRLFIETEIGFVVGKRISQPVKDVDALKKMISEVFPAVELPDIRFSDLKNMKGPDIIADAVGSSKHIVGTKIPSDKVDVGQAAVTLTLDGKEVNKGVAADVMGDQWKALLWLVNTTVANGWILEPGQILITGAMGKMIPGKPGTYKGNWGPLGTLSFTVK